MLSLYRLSIILTLFFAVCVSCLTAVFANDLSAEGAEGTQIQLITLEYPEPTETIAFLESVYVPGSHEMSYCSLITRANLQRFTGLPATSLLGEQDAILQGDAIRLIEKGLSTDTFLSITHLAKDMEKYVGDIAPYSLFDLYIYTPAQGDEITEKEYLFQGHRVVALFAEGLRRVMDPLRGNTSSWQSRDVYMQYLDPSVHIFVYNQIYTFDSSYLLDFSKKYKGKEIIETNDLNLLVYKGIIVPEFDNSFMPVASSFLKTVKLLQSGVSLTISEGSMARSDDGSPFNIGLLQSTISIQDNTGESLEITLGGKDIGFTLPFSVSIDFDILFPGDAGDNTEFLVQKDSRISGGSIGSCDDFFDKAGKKLLTAADDNELLFTLCRTGTYTITPIPLIDNGSEE